MEFILFGAKVWFWVIFGLFFVALLLAERYESGTTATISLIIFAGLVWKWGDIEAIVHKYLQWQIIVAYIAIGFVYCVFRFRLLGGKLGEKYVRALESYAKNKQLTLPLSKDQLKAFDESTYGKYELDGDEKRDKVIRWWLNWPASLMWWLLSDFLTELGNAIAKMFGGVFDTAFNSGKKNKLSKVVSND